MITYDIVLDNTQSFLTDGSGMDFLVGDAGNNYISYILQSYPGHYKVNPEVGIGIDQYLNGNFSPAYLEKAIRTQLESSGFKSPLIDMTKFTTNGTIIINKIEVQLS